MKLNIELDNLNEASVVLAALQALQNAPVCVPVADTRCDCGTCLPDDQKCAQSSDYPSVDKDGLPWDERIHSSNHKLNADGRWQRRRNVEDTYYNQVKAELLGTATSVAQAEPAFETAPCENSVENPTPVMPTAPVQPEVIAPTPLPTETPAVITSFPSETPVELPEKSANDLYNEMFAKLQQAFAAKKIDANYIQNTLATLNATFGKTWTGLAEIKEDVNALKFVIDQLTKEGL